MANPRAVVDIGTNSALLLIVRRQGRRLIALHEEISTPRLGESVGHTGRIGDKAITKLIKTLTHYQKLTHEHKCEDLYCVGTRVFRAARNSATVCNHVKADTGLEITILSAEQEAQLALRGALSGLPRLWRGLVVDVGGGSTEFIAFADRTFQRSASINIGAVSLADSHLGRYYRVSRQRLRDAQATVREQLVEVIREYSPTAGRIVGVGGTITTLAAMRMRLKEYIPESIHGQVLPSPWIKRQVERFRHLPINELRQLIPYEPERATVLPAGTFIWHSLLNMFDLPEVQVSHRGLRWGVADALFSGDKEIINST